MGARGSARILPKEQRDLAAKQPNPVKMSPQDKEVTVRTAVIQQGGPPIPIDYAMEKADGGWKVFDVVIDGASLVTTYRSSFNEQVQRGGIDGLVKTLQERNRSPEPPKPAVKVEGKK